MEAKMPRGNILLTTIVFVIPILLIIAGLAVDVADLFAVRSELHRSTDAAALAGAGALRFDSSVFPAARTNAVNYGGYNPYDYGPITLDRNDANAAGGDVVLGIWNGATGTFFVPPCISGSGCVDANGWPYETMINAVKCRTTQSLPTYFLRMVGLTGLTTSAESIAVSVAPSNPPPGVCPFPIGVSECPFLESATYVSAGCGNLISFINATENTSGWVNLGVGLGGTSDITHTPSANTTQNEISIAVAGGCPQAPLPGTSVGMNGGMDQSVMEYIYSNIPGSGDPQDPPGPVPLGGYFIQKVAGSSFDVHNYDGSVAYSGPGWQVYVPVVNSNNNCRLPEGMGSPHTIATYARIVIVQVINNGWCAIPNHVTLRDRLGNPYPNPWDSKCPTPNGTAATRDSNLRQIFAFYDCGHWDATPVIVPAPRTALADRLRLVQ